VKIGRKCDRDHKIAQSRNLRIKIAKKKLREPKSHKYKTWVSKVQIKLKINSKGRIWGGKR